MTSSSALEHALAGALAGSVSALVCSPLDVCRARLQMQGLILPPHLHARGPLDMLRSIFAQSGVRGFYAGYGAAALSVPLFWSVFLPTFATTKAYVSVGLDAHASEWLSPDARDVITQSTSAVFTALIADAITNPLWVLRTRLQVQGMHVQAAAAAADAAAEAAKALHPPPVAAVPPPRSLYRGVAHAAMMIVREEGVGALYKGLVASWLGSIHVAIYFPVYTRLRTLGADVASGAGFAAAPLPDAAPTAANPSSVDALVTILASTAAKLIASSATYPHEVVRARLQDQQALLEGVGAALVRAGAEGQTPYTGLVDCARRIWRTGGVRGLYAGFTANLLRTLPATAITFVVFEHALVVMAARRSKGVLGADLLDETALR